MEHNTIVGGGIIILMLFSLYVVVHMLATNADQLLSTTLPRMIVFAVCHVVVMGFMVRFMVVKETYEYAVWAWQLSATLSLLLTLAEVLNVIREGGLPKQVDEPMLTEELAYLNVYFLVYMYALITAFITGLFVGLTNLFIRAQQHRIAQAMQTFVKEVDFQEEMQEAACPICLDGFSPAIPIVQLVCTHIFHKACLGEWLKLNQSCPTCRRSIFQEEEDELEA